MITRIKIDGFKAFKNFEVELTPFTVIAGTNGAGKSNLFDVLHLLSRLTEVDLKTAFAEQRGNAKELFTLYDDGSYADTMYFEVDLLLDKSVRDSWGGEKKLKYTRLQYILIVKRRKDSRGIERLFITNEQLTPIKHAVDTWIKRYISKPNRDYWRPKVTGGRSASYISTNVDEQNQTTTIQLHQDGDRGGKPILAREVEKTVLSSVSNISFPHVFATKEEMRKWKFLHLNPAKLREPSPRLAKDEIEEDGANLAAALFRISLDNKRVLKNISRQLSSLLPSFKSIRVEEDTQRNLYVLKATSTDGREFSSTVLSEGTLRMIVLCVLKYDPQHSGLLCFEEPENGIHPFRLKAILKLLQNLSTSFDNEIDQELPLRQLITNTHSPVMVAEIVELSKQNDEVHLFYASLLSNTENGKKVKITNIAPVNIKKVTNQLQLPFGNTKVLKVTPAEVVTANEVINYLKTVDIETLI